MTISYPLTPPSTPGFKRFSMTALSAVGLSKSPFTFVSQAQKFAGQSWAVEATLPFMERATAEPWIAFLLSLNGPHGNFLLGDPTGKTPRGQATGTPVVNGSGQTGQVLNSSGWAVSITGILKAGDYIQIGTRLYKVLADANSDGSGLATLDIWPAIRESPANGATIITTNTKGVFRLANNTYSLWDVAEEKIYSVAFSAVEDI